MSQRGKGRNQTWKPDPHTPDSDLAWKVVRETLPGKSPLVRLLRWKSEHERTESFRWAALELTDRLNEEERARLRQSGELPEWFSPELTAMARKYREGHPGSPGPIRFLPPPDRGGM